MNKSLVFALSVLLFGLNFTIPSPAETAQYDDSSAGCHPAKKDDKAKSDVSSQKCKAKGEKSLTERVACLEQCLKDVGSRDGPGSPFPGKTKDYSKKKAQCPMSKCPKNKGSRPKEKCS